MNQSEREQMLFNVLHDHVRKIHLETSLSYEEILRKLDDKLRNELHKMGCVSFICEGCAENVRTS